LVVVCPLLFGVLGIGRANATLFVLDDSALAKRTARADFIPIGKVVGSQSSWDNGRIVTHVTIAVEATLKGKASNTITVDTPGGRIDDLAMVVPGSPQFHDGDRSILFLRSLDNDLQKYAVLDRQLGKVDVVRNADGRDVVNWVRPELQRVDVIPLHEVAAHIAYAIQQRVQ
jgi:hypothetical protein